jgi:curved DNA-binding protein CbpA
MQDVNLIPVYSTEELSAYNQELEAFLKQVEYAITHYEALGVDYLATTGEIKVAYMKHMALLHPTLYDLNLPQPEELLPRIDAAFEKVSTAFSVLVNFTRRAEYDDLLFERDELSSDLPADISSEPDVIQVKEVEPEDEERCKAVYGERRRHQRFDLKLPVRVSGFHRTNGKWLEITQSSDVSASGALLKLTKPVHRGMILHLSLPLPMTLRAHGFFEESYDDYGIVRRVKEDQQGTDLIGVEFIGEEPPPAYTEKPWGLFKYETPSWEDRRRSERKQVSKTVHIEFLDADMNVLRRAAAITEDVSREGMRVCVRQAPEELFRVKVASPNGNFQGYDNVVARYMVQYKRERLCLAFLAENA